MAHKTYVLRDPPLEWDGRKMESAGDTFSADEQNYEIAGLVAIGKIEEQQSAPVQAEPEAKVMEAATDELEPTPRRTAQGVGEYERADMRAKPTTNRRQK